MLATRISTLLVVVSAVLLVSRVADASSKIYDECSEYDVYNGTTNVQYDVEYMCVTEWTEDADDITFYLIFATPVFRTMFSDGRGSVAKILIDNNGDGVTDIRVSTNGFTYPTDNGTVGAKVYLGANQTTSKCAASTWTDVSSSAKWIGFAVSKGCLGLPNTFWVRGYADYNTSDNTGFDYAPDDFYSFTIPTSISATTTTTTTPISTHIPSAPSSIVIQKTSESSLQLTWLDNSSDELGFLVQRNDLPVVAGTTTTDWPNKTAPNQNFWTASGLATGKQYCFAVASYNGIGASSFTDFACLNLSAATITATTVASDSLACDAVRIKKSKVTASINVSAGVPNAGKKLLFEMYSKGKWIRIGYGRVSAAGAAVVRANSTVAKTKGPLPIRATQGSRFICEGTLSG